ncbi:MAG: hypothetical protein EXS36_02345 [Pedosphaera sp.]|nr:hypothetical protein [Pedosphaera sp.]
MHSELRGLVFFLHGFGAFWVGIGPGAGGFTARPESRQEDKHHPGSEDRVQKGVEAGEASSHLFQRRVSHLAKTNTSMGRQSNKIQKRARRANYAKREKERIKIRKVAKKKK